MKEYPNVLRKGRRIYSLNLTPGVSVYGESLRRFEGKEYREWDPTRSKLAAAIAKDISQTGLKIGNDVLYLGASTGTTVSHVSDIVGKNGFIFAVDFAPRVVRELVFFCEKRDNIAPILGDANQPKTYAHRVFDVDYLYMDIAQSNQAEIFLKNFVFLKNGGFAALCVKARSIDVSKKPKIVFNEVRAKLEKETTIVDYRVLDPFEKDHCIFICKK